MPIYDQVCQQCDHEWEVLRRYDEVVPCPKCGTTQVKTKISTPHVASSCDPFDYVGPGARIPDSKPIKSFANDKRKGGKDTT